MTVLLLQTFAWMLLAFVIGAGLGCFAHRLSGAGVRQADMVPATAKPGPVTQAVTPVGAPVIEARLAPAPVMPPAPQGGLAAPYDYPVSTLGIPRSAPELVQPQIQNIALSPTPTAATVSIVPVSAAGRSATASSQVDLAAAATAAPAAVVERAYPITTVGIPPGYVASNTGLPDVNTAAANLLRDVAVPPAPSQPRPEPLRPQLARPGSGPAAEPAQEDVPFTPVVTSAAAASALAARAAQAAQMGEKVSPSSPPAPAEGTTATEDDLTRIKGIDSVMRRRLVSAGVTRFSDIAKWTPGDLSRYAQTLGVDGRIERENWIEQAQILSSGAETDYSRRRQRGEIPDEVADIGGTDVPERQRAASVTSMAERATAIAAAAAAAASAAAANRATMPEPTHPTRLSDAIRERAGEDAANDASRASRPDLSGLRSVRSEALRGDVGSSDAARNSGSTRPTGPFDDLKRVRGIGVLIEKKLNSLGVTGYEQIANWTSSDIDRISQILDFKGRVERESWVEQARILASGGQTDFSRRVDRGES